MWSKWGEQLLSSGDAARERLATALEQTGDMLTERATAHVAQTKQREEAAPLTEGTSTTSQSEEKERPKTENPKMNLGTLIPGLSNVVKNYMEIAENVLSKPGPFKRNKSLPLDVEALKDAEVVYITDRIISMGHPSMQSHLDGDITSHRKLAAVGHLLENRHSGKFMVWNLSEVEYDTSILEDQVLSFQFPGSPAPPLGLMLKLLLSIESWLKADDENVVVIHCLTGRGRTATILAAFLCWIGEAGFHDPGSALEYIAKCKGCTVDALTIPSQRRYTMYFSNMFDGVRPNQPPLLLKRVILSEAPNFGKSPNSQPEDNDYGCCPYLQIFKAGHLVFTTTATTSLVDPSEELLSGVPFCSKSDGPVGFPLDVVVQGDILIRCRHLSRKGQRVSMFRAAFHTGYLPPKVLRLPKEQLDGACSDKRFSNDFFVDLIFETCDASMASQHLVDNNEAPSIPRSNVKKETKEAKNEAADRRLRGTVNVSATAHNNPDLAVSVYTYDSMLHRDSRFWDVVMKRREEHLNKPDTSTQPVVLKGPTIGRRREFTPQQEDSEPEENEKADKTSPSKPPNDPSLAFSIGTSTENAAAFMDFFIPSKPKQASSTPPKSSPKRDELMEALMAIDDEQPLTSHASEQTVMSVHEQDNDVEEIVFDSQPLLKNTSKQDQDSTDQESNQISPSQDLSETAYVEIPDNDDDDDFIKTTEDEILDFDDDDEELEDLENFLTKSGK